LLASTHIKTEWKEICTIIQSVNASEARKKRSKEKTMKGKMLYSPKTLNKLFKEAFSKRNWAKIRISTTTSITPYSNASSQMQSYYKNRIHEGFREMDFVKNKLGVEVQFGKYV